MALTRIQELFQDEREKQFTFVFRQAIKTPMGNFSRNPTVWPLDATLQEEYSLTTSITENEIQSGASLTDHIHILPQRVRIKGIISEAPILFLPAVLRSLIDAGVGAGFQALSSTTRGTLLGSGLSPVIGAIEKYAPTFIAGKLTYAILGGENRADVQRNFWEKFLKARFLEKEPFEIQSGVDNLKNVFFESITFDRDYKIGDSLVFDATLKEIRYIQSQVEVLTDAAPFYHNQVQRGQVSKDQIREEDEDNVFDGLPPGHITEVEDSIRIPASKAKANVLTLTTPFFE